MKNLIPYNSSTFEVHQSAISIKENEELKKRLSKLDAIIKSEYESFDIKFKLNKIDEVKPNDEAFKSKEDLLTLYLYQNSVIRKVRKDIEDLQIKTIINTCQNCTLTPVSSMDHVLPKSKFPEYVVNPRNLFPCCSICNGHKLASVGKDGEKLFLNLYLDELPKVQYLFVKFQLDKDGELDYQFYLENKNAIDEALFNTIHSHYEKLHLFDRIKLKSIEGISEFKNGLRRYVDKLGIDSVIEIEMGKIEEDKLAYGFNHWKCILEQSLLKNTEFIASIIKK